MLPTFPLRSMLAKRPNIVVIGASYVGLRVAKELAPRVHATHNTVVIEKNSHFHHLYAFPRITVATGFTPKAFIPYTKSLDELPPNSASIVRGTVTSIEPNQVLLENGEAVPYDYLVLATGMGAPGAYATGEKKAVVHHFDSQQELVHKAEHITVIGGGAYGVQVATDIKALHPQKKVTLIHSRDRLMNRFHPKLHELVAKKLDEYGIEYILNQRIPIPSEGFPTHGRFDIQLQNGTTLSTDLALVCIGPQSSKAVPILSTLIPTLTSVPIPVKPTMQIAPPPGVLFPNIFAVGDVADTAAAKSARPGYVQAEIVAKNIAKLIETGGQAKDEELEKFTPPPHAIHLYLGVKDSVVFRNPETENGEAAYKFGDNGHIELGCPKLWATLAKDNTDYTS